MSLAIRSVGLVTPVGLTAAASCCAFRAAIGNPGETRFGNANGEWIKAHQVPLTRPWRGISRLAKMTAMSIDEALVDVAPREWARLPLFLCVAESERSGRLSGLEDELPRGIQDALGVRFAASPIVLAKGRVGLAIALVQARTLLAQGTARAVLIAAVDTFLTRATLDHYDREGRLLTDDNSNGFVPGEAAGALVVERAAGQSHTLFCCGIGFGLEPAHVGSDEPLRADGLTKAVRTALDEAGRQMHEMDFRITDNSGEHYAFKESALVALRSMRDRKHEFDLWHPAECTGEIGSAAGISIVAAVKAACEKGYAKGPRILAHLGNDTGERAALCFEHGAIP